MGCLEGERVRDRTYDFGKTVAITELGSRISIWETWLDCKPRFERSSDRFSVGPVQAAKVENDHPHSPNSSQMFGETKRLTKKSYGSQFLSRRTRRSS